MWANNSKKCSMSPLFHIRAHLCTYQQFNFLTEAKSCDRVLTRTTFSVSAAHMVDGFRCYLKRVKK